MSVCVSALTVNGPELQPLRLRMEPRRLEAGEGYTIAHVDKCTMSEAMDERRLVVVLDETGTVRSVSDTPQTLFGFVPGALWGVEKGGEAGQTRGWWLGVLGRQAAAARLRRCLDLHRVGRGGCWQGGEAGDKTGAALSFRCMQIGMMQRWRWFALDH